MREKQQHGQPEGLLRCRMRRQRSACGRGCGCCASEGESWHCCGCCVCAVPFVLLLGGSRVRSTTSASGPLRCCTTHGSSCTTGMTWTCPG